VRRTLLSDSAAIRPGSTFALLVFDPELPQLLLTSWPLAMLVQIADESHVRVGFKAKKSDPWLCSKTLDTKVVFGKSIS
jgi:hypothetical protein